MAEGRQWSHVPHADLVARALDGVRSDWEDVAVRHVDTCPACRERLALYERAVAAGRLACPESPLLSPPARLRASVQEAVRSAARAEEAGDEPPSADSPAPPDDRARWRRGAHVLGFVTRLGRAAVRLLARLGPRRSRGPEGPDRPGPAP
ncbi:hypothetical protein ABT090_13730 [Streptomyces asoensis]|uniref:hypothetical protein n=1 Tax=Streptomyces asoensis TaxID=249586 RepID=UPI00332C0669